jgi:5'-nucleotidase
MCKAQTESVVIVYTHNTNGVLENCDCPERSYGALEKRAAVIDSLRNSDQNILLVDTGDILDIQQNRILHNYVVKAYDYMNYDYWVPGDQDFIEGSDFFLNKLSTISATLLSTNIMHKEKLIGKNYITRNFGKKRIGITGTIRDDLSKYLDPPVNADFKFEEQFSSLGPVIKELSEKSDFIILLSHSGFERDRQIAEKYPSINLIIGSHSQTILPEPEMIGSTYIVQIGESGYRVGIFKIIFDNNKIQTTESRVILLTKGMSEDLIVNDMIRDYHQERMVQSGEDN